MAPINIVKGNPKDTLKGYLDHMMTPEKRG